MTQASDVDHEAESNPSTGSGQDLVLVPMRRTDLRCIKAVKFNEAELAKIGKFQEWLATTVNPETGLPFIPRNEFSALVQFCLLLACRRWLGRFVEQRERAIQSYAAALQVRPLDPETRLRAIENYARSLMRFGR